MKTALSTGAARLLTKLNKDCVNLTRMTRRTWAIVEELQRAGYSIQVEHPLHEGYWVTLEKGRSRVMQSREIE